MMQQNSAKFAVIKLISLIYRMLYAAQSDKNSTASMPSSAALFNQTLS